MKVGYKLDHIRELSLRYSEPSPEVQAIMKETNSRVMLDMTFRLNDNQLKIITQVELVYKKNKSEESVFELTSECCYSLFGDYEKYISKKKEELIFDNNFFDTVLAPLISISLSSTRGLVAGKTQGSFLNKFPIPIFDGNDFVKYVKARTQIDTKSSPLSKQSEKKQSKTK